MANSPENTSMAVFCDFENVALGVRDANYEKFDIKPVLERLLLKGSIVVKKSYCDWDRYKSFKAAMHEANFELIEIPHVRQSGKNSADIRLVVDALDLCYTKSHVNTFVIISGDSDFSPLVSKLRENAKQVIGVGVKQSTSDLLVANCDEFIFYDDLVRETRRSAAKRERGSSDTATTQQRRTPEEEKRHREDLDKRRTHAIDIALETFEALIAERGDSGKIWASMLKQAIKRRKPDFNENYFGFRTFGNLIEEAQSRGLLEFGRDEKSGAYVYRANAERAASNGVDTHEPPQNAENATPTASSEETVPMLESASPLSEDVTTTKIEHGEAPDAEAPSSKRPARKPARLSAREAKVAREKSAREKTTTQVIEAQEAQAEHVSHEPAVEVGGWQQGGQDQGAGVSVSSVTVIPPIASVATATATEPASKRRGGKSAPKGTSPKTGAKNENAPVRKNPRRTKKDTPNEAASEAASEKLS